MSDKVQILFFGSQTSRGVCVFSAGQQVQAQVLLNLAEPMKARSVKIHITGRAEVHWTESESHTSRDMHGKDETRHETIHFRSNAVYMDQQATLWTAPTANQQQIAVGHHRFPFTFNIPAHCPPSFEGTYGHIRYICTAIIDRPWKFDKKAKASFVVSPFVDLNAVEWALTPVTGQKEKDIGILLFKHGKLNVKAHLPKSGFVAGERIPLQVEVDNGTSKEVRKVKAKLVEKVVFIAQRNHTLHYDLCVTNTWGSQSQHFAKRTSSQKVAQLEQPFTVAAHSKGLHQAQLAIPPCVPSFNTCPLIRVDYVLEIKVETNASFGSTAAIEVPLLLGTIPVRVRQWPQQQPSMAPVYSAEPNAPPPSSASGGGLYPSLNEPSAPPMEFASAPPLPSYPYPTGPPPAYEESVLTGARSVGEDGEQYTPRYPYYKDL